MAWPQWVNSMTSHDASNCPGLWSYFILAIDYLFSSKSSSKSVFELFSSRILQIQFNKIAIKLKTPGLSNMYQQSHVFDWHSYLLRAQRNKSVKLWKNVIYYMFELSMLCTDHIFFTIYILYVVMVFPPYFHMTHTYYCGWCPYGQMEDTYKEPGHQLQKSLQRNFTMDYYRKFRRWLATHYYLLWVHRCG